VQEGLLNLLKQMVRYSWEVTGIALTPKGRNILMAEDTVRPRGM
jgi:hypothetical protein